MFLDVDWLKCQPLKAIMTHSFILFVLLISGTIIVVMKCETLEPQNE